MAPHRRLAHASNVARHGRSCRSLSGQCARKRSEPAIIARRSTGLNPETGLGRVISITDRKTSTQTVVGWSASEAKTDNLTQVGAIKWPPNDKPAWSWDTDHTPSPFYPAYILTGDPWYLDEMYTWAAFAAATPNYATNQVSVAVRPAPTAASRPMSVERHGPHAIAPRPPLPPRTTLRKKRT